MNPNVRSPPTPRPQPVYSISYLPIALRDLQKITRYLANDLHNPATAERIATGIVAAIDEPATMPYRRAVYLPIRPLAHEFRTIRSGSYLAFYWVGEESKTVTVARILHARMDISKRLSEAERPLP